MDQITPIAVTDAVLTDTSVAESEAAWAIGTTYALGNVVKRTLDNVHRRWISAQNTNLAHDPATDDGTWWTDDGPTNRWAMFEAALQVQTAAADEIEVELTPGAWADTLAALNISAAAAHVKIEVPGEVDPVLDEDYTLVDCTGITGWWEYFTTPIVRKRDFILQGLPVDVDAVITFTLTAVGETVRCGVLLAGFAIPLGNTQWGSRMGIRDYSLKTDDPFGGITITPRGYRKRATFTVIGENTALDQVVNLLTDARATPTLFIGNNTYGSSCIYGFATDWNVETSLPPDLFLLSLELESLA